MKLVGGDSGRYEHEEFVEEVLLAPSERVVVDVLFDRARRADARAPHPRADLPARRDHRRPATPADAGPRPSEFEALRTNADMVAERERLAPYLDAPSPTRRSRSSPRWTWAPRRRRPVVYACPMHPEVVSDGAGQVPEVRHEAARGRRQRHDYVCPMHPEVVSDAAGPCPKCGMKLAARAAWSASTPTAAHEHARA